MESRIDCVRVRHDIHYVSPTHTHLVTIPTRNRDTPTVDDVTEQTLQNLYNVTSQPGYHSDIQNTGINIYSNSHGSDLIIDPKK